MNAEQRNNTGTVSGVHGWAPGKYRSDIDGLRCVAILLVLFYHAFPKAVPGGFIGVDVFFVISGFLITALLLVERDKPVKQVILNFYARRTRRIFPALIVVLLATGVLGYLLLPPGALQSLGANMVGGSLFSANIVQFLQSGYFDIDAEKKPLLHLWSLGIEEQFYIFWPLLVIFAAKRRLNLVSLTLLLIAVSFALNLGRIGRHPTSTFFLPTTRSWELLAGALIAALMEASAMYPALRVWEERLDRLAGCVIWDHAALRRSVLADVRAFIGVVLIVYATSVLNRHSQFPGGWAALPTIGAVLLITSPSAWFNRVVLSSRLFVGIGLISYPLYLWHYPILAYLHIHTIGSVKVWPAAGAVALSVVLAWLTYRFIEPPLRYGHGARFKIAGLGMVMACIGAFGLFVYIGDGLPQRVPEKVRVFVTANPGAEIASHWRRGSCLLLPDQDQSNFTDDCAGVTGRPTALIWGDSYAAAVFAGLSEAAEKYGFTLAQYTASACPPLLGYDHPERRFCKGINYDVLSRIEKIRPEIVILHSTWKNSDAIINAGLKATVSELRRIGIKRIILLGPGPSWMGNSLPDNIVDYYFTSGGQIIPERTKFRLEGPELQAIMREKAEREGVEYVSEWDVFCNGDGCLARIGPEPQDIHVFDVGHLTNRASKYLAERIAGETFGPSAK